MIYYFVAFALIVTMALALVRAIKGPGLYDRVLAVNMMGTKTVLLLAVVAYIVDRPDYLDLALAYALINFIGVFAVLEFFRNRDSKLAELAERDETGGPL
ncbi:MAG TPA: monovalent cation/H+ antiporter complex subunit F [Pseudomonadales bacterium]|nr:monovalent cation/H+ antiporter complex subunit F [Pseudomonadales bacterium]